MSRFIMVATYTNSHNDFNTTTQIIAALNFASIKRLKKTWKLLDPKVHAKFMELNSFISVKNNYGLYRKKLKRVVGPTLPYLGICCNDLFFIEESEPSCVKVTDDKNQQWELIRLTKIYTIERIIEDLRELQLREPYTFPDRTNIRNQLLNLDTEKEETLYEMSLEREPRAQSKIAARTSTQVTATKGTTNTASDRTSNVPQGDGGDTTSTIVSKSGTMQDKTQGDKQQGEATRQDEEEDETETQEAVFKRTNRATRSNSNENLRFSLKSVRDRSNSI